MEEGGRDPWLAEARVPELSNSETDELAKTVAVTLACLMGHFSLDELCDVVGNLIFCQLIRLLHFTKIDIIFLNKKIAHVMNYCWIIVLVLFCLPMWCTQLLATCCFYGRYEMENIVKIIVCRNDL